LILHKKFKKLIFFYQFFIISKIFLLLFQSQKGLYQFIFLFSKSLNQVIIFSLLFHTKIAPQTSKVSGLSVFSLKTSVFFSKIQASS
jgi:hypothetical protein